MASMIERTLQKLAAQVPGCVSLPGDERYVAATAIWAKPVNRVPRAVVHCRTNGDVQRAVRAAQDSGLPLSVRGGGHDWAGRALCDGVVIDLSKMNTVTVVESDDRVARISGGATAADVLAVTDPLGLTVVTGSVGSVGMAGLTLGGGYGPLIARFGLALDNLVAAEIVLADGRVALPNDDNEAELFWALRGGGGNFGVVTAMHHRLHWVPSVRVGMLIYPFSEARAVLEGYVDIVASAPEELSVQLVFICGADGAPVLAVVPTWCGEQAAGEAQIAPLQELGTLIADTVSVVSYRTLLSLFDAYLVSGQRVIMETSWLPALDRDNIDVLIDAMAAAVSPGCAIICHHFRGAASRVPLDATAFGLRRDHVLVEMLATFADRSDDSDEERHAHWARATREAFAVHALPGGYPNLLASDQLDRAAKAFGRNAGRLALAKRRYDPNNLFRSAIPLPAPE